MPIPSHIQEDKFFPVRYKEVEEAAPDCIAFSDVEITRDFGPLRKGDKCGTIWFFLEHARCDVYNLDVLTFSFAISCQCN